MDNLSIYSWRIRPRVLINVQNRDTKCDVLGMKIDFPIAIAPTAMQRMAHPDGECATAKGNRIVLIKRIN